MTATNDGSATWLPAADGIGGVSLGCNLLDAAGALQTADYLWFRTPVSEEPVLPGESLEFEVELRAPDEPGGYQIEFDLVSEQVTWFAVYGTTTVRVPLEVA